MTRWLTNVFRSAILEEVQNQGNTKLPSNKNVLVLGDNETGKTTLVAKLQGVEDPKKGSALEYAYIDISDEYRDGKCVFIPWKQSKNSMVPKLTSTQDSDHNPSVFNAFTLHLKNCSKFNLTKT